MSEERSIAGRYATALFELRQDGIDVAEDLSKVAQVVCNEDAKALLINSQISAEDRTAVIMKAASVSSDYVSRLLVLLCSRNKAELVSVINEILTQKILESNAQVLVEVTVASKMDAKLAAKLKDAVGKDLGMKVDLTVATDASILGGLILNVGDRQIDHSVRGRLNGLKRTLSV